MFRVNLFCDDKRLPDVLRNLMGLAVGIPEVQPVANAVKSNGAVKAGSLEEQFTRYAKSHKIEKFKAGDLTEFCKIAGMAPASRGYLVKQLQKIGAVKKHGTGTKTYYTVSA